MADLERMAPKLNWDDLTQIAALPLGSWLKTDPWDDTEHMLNAKRYAPMNARDKMPLEVTPIFYKLQRYDAAKLQTPPPAATPAESPATAAPAAQPDTGAPAAQPDTGELPPPPGTAAPAAQPGATDQPQTPATAPAAQQSTGTDADQQRTGVSQPPPQ
jgi:hypothetical protein